MHNYSSSRTITRTRLPSHVTKFKTRPHAKMAEPEYPGPEGSRAVADSSPAAVLVENTEHQEVSEGGSVLQAVDLHSRSQTHPASDQTPVLQFDSGSGEMEEMKADSETSLHEVSPIEGTELHRVRTSSK